jgi:hypothetical protein
MAAAGRDLLVGNTQADQLVDWSGEYNNYVVPFSIFGGTTVVRSPAPWVTSMLVAISKSDGADQTRTGDPTRGNEPNGELGLVLQADAIWAEQTGSPVGGQAGNTKKSASTTTTTAATTTPPAPTTTMTTLAAPSTTTTIESWKPPRLPPRAPPWRRLRRTRGSPPRSTSTRPRAAL